MLLVLENKNLNKPIVKENSQYFTESFMYLIEHIINISDEDFKIKFLSRVENFIQNFFGAKILRIIGIQ